MNKNIIYILTLALIFSACKKDENEEDIPEEEPINWTLMEGTMSYHSGAAMQLTPDNGIVLTGNLNTNYQVYKTSTGFQETWSVNKGLQAFEEANAVVVTDNNNYIIAGNSAFGFESRVYVLRLDVSGNIVWSQNYEWADISVCHGICKSNDNKYVLCGHSQDVNNRDSFGDVQAMMINDDGDTLWNRIYEDIGEETAYAIVSTNDGGFVMTGRDENNNNKDLALIKIDANGNLLWFNFFGGNTWDEGFYVIEDQQGNLLACGMSQSNDSQVYVVKTNSSGILIWERTFGRSDRSEKGFCIQQTSGGYVISGSQYIVENIDDDIYLLKIDNEGNFVWEQTYGGSNSDYGNAVRILPDDKLVIAGTTKSNSVDGQIYLLKTDANGNMQ